MPKKLASRKKAVKVSYERSGPWIGPDMRASTLQFVPNWNAMTIPETTPSPNATPKIFSQNSNTRRYAGRPVHKCRASRTVSHAASPIVKDGKMMWNETVNANCSRDSRSAVRSIGISSPVLCDPFGVGKHLEPVVTCDADEGEAYRLCSADCQSGRRGHPDYDRRSHHSGFLHKLNGNPARQHNDALGSRPARAQQHACQFIERIVASYVLTKDQLSMWPPKCRGMDRAGLHIQLLSRRQRGHCFRDVVSVHLQVAARDRYRTIGFGQTLQSAHAASGRSHRASATRRKCIGPVACQPHSQHDAVDNTHDGQFCDLSRRRDDPFRVAETESEIL